MQARDGMFALKEAIKRRFGEQSSEARTVIASAVVFPDVPAPPVGIEAEGWEFIDRDALTSRPISKSINSILKQQRARLTGLGEPGADGATLKSIRTFLRPDFDYVVARSTMIQRADEQLLRLAAEQYDALDSIALNERCIVEGAAGTGKTLLAVELARRAQAAGRRPILLCFNRLLGRWLERELERSSIIVGNYHRVLRRLITDSSVRLAFERDAPDFSEWPLYALEAVSESGSIGDLLIIDEAQDLATDSALCVFDAMLEGGLAGGSWVMMGDFERQSIFGGVSSSFGFGGFRKMLQERSPYLSALRLQTNYRNTRQIAEETAMVSGFDSMPYRLNSAEGPAVDFRYWNSDGEDLAQLRDVLEDLRRDGTSNSNITILSPVRLQTSVAAKLGAVGIKVTEVTDVDDRSTSASVRFATIQSFKGLETPVAILTDLRGMEDADRQALFYVAMSRARLHLILILHNSIKPHVTAAFRRRLNEGSDRD